MIVAMQETASEEQVQQVVEHLIRMGFSVHRTTGERQTVLADVGARVDFDTRNLEVLSGVEHVHRISAPYKLAGRSFFFLQAEDGIRDVAVTGVQTCALPI